MHRGLPAAAPAHTPGSVCGSPVSCGQLEVHSEPQYHCLLSFCGFGIQVLGLAEKDGPVIVDYSALETHSPGSNMF